MIENKYIIFTDSRSIFSNWYPSEFTIDGVKFKNIEAFMCYKRAMLFGDAETAEEVLKANHPRDCKELGKNVKGYVKSIFLEDLERFLYDGNYAKFSQNSLAMKELIGSGNSKIIYANQFDFVYGTGLDEDRTKKTQEDKWPGSNFLGKSLTKVREDFRNIHKHNKR